MKLATLLSITLLLVACNKAAAPAPVPIPPKPRDASNVVVTLKDEPHLLDKPSATWDAEKGELTVIMTRQRERGEVHTPRARLVLQVKEHENLSLENVGKVTLAFENFPKTGNATMTGGNQREAIKTLSGSAKPGEQVALEYNWKSDTQECKGKVIATVR